jgi:hypothetical protein
MQFDHLKRREFITLLVGAGTWPLAARGQQSTKLPTIGVLGSDAAAWRPWTAALVERLHELGWIEGRTIAIEYRWSQARPEAPLRSRPSSSTARSTTRRSTARSRCSANRVWSISSA